MAGKRQLTRTAQRFFIVLDWVHAGSGMCGQTERPRRLHKGLTAVSLPPGTSPACTFAQQASCMFQCLRSAAHRKCSGHHGHKQSHVAVPFRMRKMSLRHGACAPLVQMVQTAY